EAVNLSSAHTRRQKIVVSKTVHPESRAVIHSYGTGLGLEVVEIDQKDGYTDLEALEKEVDENTASIVVQYPNFFGQIEPMDKIEEIKKSQKKTMLLVSSNQLALGYLTPPSEFVADIVVEVTHIFCVQAIFV